jgi:Type IV secretion system pilin
MIKRLALVLTLLVALMTATPAYAYDFFGSACNGDTGNTATCKDNTGSNPLVGDNGLILKIANIIAFIAGAAAVIIILISALRFITAGGDANKAAEARSTLLGAVIGIAVIVLAKVLIDFVLSKL